MNDEEKRRLENLSVLIKKYGLFDKLVKESIEGPKERGLLSFIKKNLSLEEYDAFNEEFFNANLGGNISTGSKEWYLRGLGVLETDRLREYQFMRTFIPIWIKDAGGREVGDVGTDRLLSYWTRLDDQLVSKCKCFELSNEISQLLDKTDSNIESLKHLPYGNFFIGGDLTIDGEDVIGLFTYRALLTNDDGTETEATLCWSLIRRVHEGGDALLHVDMIDLNETRNDRQKKILNFICSFVNFLNEPEVVVVDREVNPKNNERRIKRDLMPLPANPFIRITGELKRYVSEMSESSRSLSHRFWVRGHFMNLRNRKRFRRLYALDEKKLIQKGYSLSKDQTIIKWKKPYVKGSGILVNKPYKVGDKSE